MITRVCVLIGMACVLAPVSRAEDGYSVHRGVVYNHPARKPLKMTVFTPDDGRELHPAVLLIHGGGWLLGTRYQLDWYGRHLARHGYVAATVDYRMMPRYAFPECLHDCKLGVMWLRANAAEYGIDPERIGAFGNSAGGHLTALLAATTPEDGFEPPSSPAVSSAIQTAVVLYGVTDMSYYKNPEGYIRLFGFTSRFIGNFVTRRYRGDGDAFDAASPVHYADASMCPTLFIHGTEDNLVPYGQTVAFYGQLLRSGVPARLITVSHGHAFDFFVPGARARIFPEIVEFLDTHLKGSGDSGPRQPRN
jgi:acetyl esterase/lipase